MSIADSIKESMEKSSWIRRMFEEGLKLKAKAGEENVFDFSLGNPDIPPPAEFFVALEQIVAKSKSDLLVNEHGYMSNAGFTETRDAVAGRVSADHDVELKGDSIVMTCGAAGGLNVVFKTILNPGEEVIVPKPFFFEYISYVANHGGKTVFADTNEDFSLNINNIKLLITNKTKAVLINSPNNPSGKVYSEDDIKELAELLNSEYSKNGRVIYLLSDEPYRELVYDGKKVPGILKYYNNSIVVASFSKTLSVAGERIGYIAANPACDEIGNLMSGLILCNRILGFVNAPALMQRVIAKIINTHIDINIYKKERSIHVRPFKCRL